MATPDDRSQSTRDGTPASSYSPLLRAVFDTPDSELLETVRWHLAAGQDPNAASAYGETPLGQAFRRGRMDVVDVLVSHGADVGVMGWGELHGAVLFGTLDDVLAAAHGSAVEVRDVRGLTPFLLAVDIGDISKAEALLPLTSEAGKFTDHDNQPALHLAAAKGRAGMARWLLARGFAVDEANAFGGTALIEAASADNPEIVRLLLEAGASLDARYNLTAAVSSSDIEEFGLPLPEELDEFQFYHTPTSETVSAAVARLLIAAGAEPGDFSNEVLAELTGSDRIPAQRITPEIFAAERDRRFGTANPERIDRAFWTEMVRTGMSAFAAFGDFGAAERDYAAGPIWSFARFGMSTTQLPDGRWVQIAGEHEDFYDEDFLIYNEVFVHDGDGGLTIYGYPRDVFPPTDFHSATVVDDGIIVIGNLGYPADRVPGQTQVFQLDVPGFRFKRIETQGDAPGWIHGHRAEATGSAIVVSGGTLWDGEDLKPYEGQSRLSLETMTWERMK